MDAIDTAICATLSLFRRERTYLERIYLRAIRFNPNFKSNDRVYRERFEYKIATNKIRENAREQGTVLYEGPRKTPYPPIKKRKLNIFGLGLITLNRLVALREEDFYRLWLTSEA